MTLPALPEANQDEQVWFSEEREDTRANLRRRAPNQNPSVDLIDMSVDFGDAGDEGDKKKNKYVSHVAKRVSQRRKEERTNTTLSQRRKARRTASGYKGTSERAKQQKCYCSPYK